MSANTMVISGYIGNIKCDDDGNVIEDNTGNGLMERFNKMVEGSPTECTVVFRSCYGGSVYDGIPLANAMLAARNAGIKVITVIEGLAASMAGFCFVHGQDRLIDRLSRWHVHRPTGGNYGTWEELAAQADNLKSLEADIIKRYAECTGQTTEFVMANWCNGPDHEFGADYCLANGVATKIIESALVPKEAADITYDNTEMLAKALTKVMLAKTEPTKTDQTIMSKYSKETKELFGLPETATDAEVEAKATAQREAETQLATMEAEREAEINAAIEAEITQAVADNKLLAGEKAQFVEMGKKLGLPQMKVMLAKMQAHKPITQQLHKNKPAGQSLAQMSGKELTEKNLWPQLRQEVELDEFKQIFKAHYGFDYTGE